MKDTKPEEINEIALSSNLNGKTTKTVKFIIRFGLVTGLLVSLLFYFFVISRSSRVEIMYARYHPLLIKLFIHDCLTIPLMVYWCYLVLYFNRVKRPLIPLLIFLLYFRAIPIMIMGTSVTLLYFKRLGTFKMGYPIALASLAVWTIFSVWEKTLKRRRIRLQSDKQ
jgi:hypothetical protein